MGYPNTSNVSLSSITDYRDANTGGGTYTPGQETKISTEVTTHKDYWGLAIPGAPHKFSEFINFPVNIYVTPNDIYFEADGSAYCYGAPGCGGSFIDGKTNPYIYLNITSEAERPWSVMNTLDDWVTFVPLNGPNPYQSLPKDASLMLDDNDSAMFRNSYVDINDGNKTVRLTFSQQAGFSAVAGNGSPGQLYEIDTGSGATYQEVDVEFLNDGVDYIPILEPGVTYPKDQGDFVIQMNSSTNTSATYGISTPSKGLNDQPVVYYMTWYYSNHTYRRTIKVIWGVNP
jgi:hypothetical protein